MYSLLRLLLPVFLLAFGAFTGAFANTPMPGTRSPLPAAPQKLIINNRPLVKVNGRTISLIDVVKLMRLQLYEHQPHLLDSPIDLYRYYTANWRHQLEEMVFGEFLLAEAQEKEVSINEGDVREALEQRFGPNVIRKLDEIGLTIEEARTIIHNDIVSQNMQWYKIYSPALQTVTPEAVKQAYVAHLEANPPKEEWVYETLTIRGEEDSLCKKIAFNAASILHTTAAPSLLQVVADLNSENPKGTSISLSEEFRVDATTISEQHKNVLDNLKPSEYSEPIAQKSRANNSTVYRIFHLKAHEQQKAPPFELLAENLKNQLINEKYGALKKAYFEKLKHHFAREGDSVYESISSSYIPFTIQ